MIRDELLNLVRTAVVDLEPTAKVILYGSRARGDTGADSDWDFLILLEGQVEVNRIDRVRARLYTIELEFDQILSSLIIARDEWEQAEFMASPFHENVVLAGVTL